MIGANAPSGLASRPISFVVAEEVDRWEASPAGKRRSFRLALVRTEKFPIRFGSWIQHQPSRALADRDRVSRTDKRMCSCRASIVGTSS